MRKRSLHNDRRKENMNIHEQFKRGKQWLKDGWHFLKSTFEGQWKIFAGYTIIASLLCIVIAEISQVNQFRVWYYNLIRKDVISKSVEYVNDTKEEDYGSFITYYRHNVFGASKSLKVDSDTPMVALTFDDGPNPEYTGRILKALKDNESHATFFVVGTNAEQYPDTLRAIASSGNEIGNHTYSHANLTDIDSAEVEKEIDKVNRAVKKATGEMATVIRPPYGAYNNAVLEQLQQPVILWDVDTEDWDSRNAQAIVDHIIANIEDGDIILMHDIYDSTAEAVELLIPCLKEMGYQVVSVSEMAHYKEKELELHKAYGGVKE